jgi:alpha-glucosidase (family GH31 glycosyl hydrolase)
MTLTFMDLGNTRIASGFPLKTLQEPCGAGMRMVLGMVREFQLLLIVSSNCIDAGTNLYGNHPIYFEHRNTGSHGVFLFNSNGMDIKINQTEKGQSYLEYNVIGGVLDFYFLAGSTTDPIELTK